MNPILAYGDKIVAKVDITLSYAYYWECGDGCCSDTRHDDEYLKKGEFLVFRGYSCEVYAGYYGDNPDDYIFFEARPSRGSRIGVFQICKEDFYENFEIEKCDAETVENP